MIIKYLIPSSFITMSTQIFINYMKNLKYRPMRPALKKVGYIKISEQLFEVPTQYSRVFLKSITAYRLKLIFLFIN